MDCEDCGSKDAMKVEVEFTDGIEREIPLCEECRDAYREGELVAGVENE